MSRRGGVARPEPDADGDRAPACRPRPAACTPPSRRPPTAPRSPISPSPRRARRTRPWPGPRSCGVRRMGPGSASWTARTSAVSPGSSVDDDRVARRGGAVPVGRRGDVGLIGAGSVCGGADVMRYLNPIRPRTPGRTALMRKPGGALASFAGSAGPHEQPQSLMRRSGLGVIRRGQAPTLGASQDTGEIRRSPPHAKIAPTSGPSVKGA
jgi:hypothetical protein